ncbi:MAG: aspartate kinase [Desulfobacterota bacterium]|nr:aspartate kinase [Thermodesulfobacteriota bacterium]MDW8002258.1 aspartate kinase [Deltaproteobacteria bacterium]
MMLVVQKYGGTSVGDLERIKNVAKRIISYRERGDSLVVVVSAMAGETDRLISLATSITKTPDERELDVLLTTGEQVVSALLAITLNSMYCSAVSLQGHQVRIITDSTYTKARIIEVEKERILSELNKGRVVIVSGFQGIDKNGNITTLGRGGSDTTAVALAAALGADLCEIYTDVDGVFTADPNVCPKAKRLDYITYDEMLEMASLGAKVLQIRSVELAKRYNVPILVKSSFTEGPGTLVSKEVPNMAMEKVVVSGVTFNKNEAKITISKVPDRPGIAAKIFSALADANIVVDIIVQNVSKGNYTDITFTVSKGDARKAHKIAEQVAKEIGAEEVTLDEDIAKVSIVGSGMRSHYGVAAKMFSTLASEGINIEAITTSEIKISCVIEAKYAELAVQALHTAFGLDKEDIEEETICQ